jgi:hypothetical protein
MVNFLLSTSTFNFQKNNDVYKKSHNKSVEPTPPPFAIRLLLGSLFVLFLSIILFTIRGCSPQTLCARNIKMSATAGKLLGIFITRLNMQEDGVTIPDDSIKVVTKELVEKLTRLDPMEKIDIITGEENTGNAFAQQPVKYLLKLKFIKYIEPESIGFLRSY